MPRVNIAATVFRDGSPKLTLYVSWFSDFFSLLIDTFMRSLYLLCGFGSFCLSLALIFQRPMRLSLHNSLEHAFGFDTKNIKFSFVYFTIIPPFFRVFSLWPIFFF